MRRGPTGLELPGFSLLQAVLGHDAKLPHNLVVRLMDQDSCKAENRGSTPRQPNARQCDNWHNFANSGQLLGLLCLLGLCVIGGLQYIPRGL